MEKLINSLFFLSFKGQGRMLQETLMMEELCDLIVEVTLRERFLCYNLSVFVSQVNQLTYLADSLTHHNVPFSLLTLTASLTLCRGRQLEASWLASMQHWPGASRRRRC